MRLKTYTIGVIACAMLAGCIPTPEVEPNNTAQQAQNNNKHGVAKGETKTFAGGLGGSDTADFWRFNIELVDPSTGNVAGHLTVGGSVSGTSSLEFKLQECTDLDTSTTWPSCGSWATRETKVIGPNQSFNFATREATELGVVGCAVYDQPACHGGYRGNEFAWWRVRVGGSAGTYGLSVAVTP